MALSVSSRKKIVPTRIVSDTGLLVFVKKKLEQGALPDDIERSLVVAGFSKKEIALALKEVHIVYPDTHQDIAASHDFLPDLKKPIPQNAEVERIEQSERVTMHQVEKIERNKRGKLSRVDTYTERNEETKALVFPVIQKEHKAGDFGRYIKSRPKHKTGQSDIPLFSPHIGRKDFVVSLIFTVSMAVLFLLLLVSIAQVFFPEALDVLRAVIAGDTYMIWLAYIPLLCAPFTLLILSLLARRLKDIGLPRRLGIVFLALFVHPLVPIVIQAPNPFGQALAEYTAIGILALQFMALCLFVLLVCKRGSLFYARRKTRTSISVR